MFLIRDEEPNLVVQWRGQTEQIAGGLLRREGRHDSSQMYCSTLMLDLDYFLSPRRGKLIMRQSCLNGSRYFAHAFFQDRSGGPFLSQARSVQPLSSIPLRASG